MRMRDADLVGSFRGIRINGTQNPHAHMQHSTFARKIRRDIHTPYRVTRIFEVLDGFLSIGSWKRLLLATFVSVGFSCRILSVALVTTRALKAVALIGEFPLLATFVSVRFSCRILPVALVSRWALKAVALIGELLATMVSVGFLSPDIISVALVSRWALKVFARTHVALARFKTAQTADTIFIVRVTT